MQNIIFSFHLKLKMIAILKLSILLISASLTIASKRCCRNVKKLKKQNKQLQIQNKQLQIQNDQLQVQNEQLQLQNEQLESIIQELETDGEWGSWSGWSACRSISFCGRGFTTRSRSCTPQGKYCEGDTVEAQECLTSGLNTSRSSRSD